MPASPTGSATRRSGLCLVVLGITRYTPEPEDYVTAQGRRIGNRIPAWAGQAASLRCATINFAGVDYQKFQSNYLVGAGTADRAGRRSTFCSRTTRTSFRWPLEGLRSHHRGPYARWPSGRRNPPPHLNVARYLHALRARALSRRRVVGVCLERHRNHRRPHPLRRAARGVSHSSVRYLILSDIHGNWEALQAVLAHARSK